MKKFIRSAHPTKQKNSTGLAESYSSPTDKFIQPKYKTFLLKVLVSLLFFILTGNAWGQIAFRGTSTANVNSTLLTINRPAGVVQGDLMIVNIAKYGDNVTTPTSFGWALIDGRSLGTSRYGAVLYRVAGAAEPATYTFSLATANRRAVGSIVAFSGVDPIAPFDVAPGIITVAPAASVNVSANSITTVTANAAVVMFGMAAYTTMGGVTFGNLNWNTTSPGALTEIYDNNYSAYGNAGAAWAIKATAGATGPGAARLSASRENGGILLALRPQPICTGVAPTTQASNVSFIASCMPVDISWTRGDGNYCAVFMKNTGSGTAAPVDGMAYAASSTFLAGDQIGASGWFCVYNGSGTSVSVTNLTPGSVYGVHVCEYNCSGAAIRYNTSLGAIDNPNFSAPVSDCYYHPTTGINGSSVGECMTLINAPSAYYDDGGPLGNYSTNITHGGGIYRTFCPGSPNQAVRATFTMMDIGVGDRLTVVNGASGSNVLPQLWAGRGTLGAPNPLPPASWPVLTSTDVSGCLTFRFSSDASGTGAGWAITLTTVASASWKAPVNSDCQTAITICNTQNIIATSNGPGLRSNCPAGCLGAEYYTNWYVWKVTTAGTMDFTITPNLATDDYDFALYKATDCSVMGDPVRCSFYSGTGATGLDATESDTEENTTFGNGLVKDVNVAADEYYFLMISDYTKEGTGFRLSFGGSCSISCESPLPVEMLSFNATCEDDHVAVDWSTATETNNDYFTIERSDDATNWVPVKSVPGAGNSNSVQSYTTTDENPLTGTSYYRLKQTDFNGHSEVFSPVATTCARSRSSAQINYYPNPFSDAVVVDFQNLNFNKATLVIYNVIGKKVFQKDISNTDFPDSKLNISLSDLPSGIYMASFSSDGYTETSRILKK
jgi:hypothetical protein